MVADGLEGLPTNSLIKGLTAADQMRMQRNPQHNELYVHAGSTTSNTIQGQKYNLHKLILQDFEKIADIFYTI